ncbi:Arc family DNA-binding protein [Acinetobacter calcoaceticus]|uniref:Arc family DNA-binding protein n=1 Tax=Acinetobacter calcoaceticus TaxID=471 RepID=UPI003A87359C
MSKHLGVEYKVRMPQELKDKITESAKELNRSMNADIVARLEDSFPPTNHQEAYKRYINKRILNLTYTIERLELQIGNANFLIKTNANDIEKTTKWNTIKEFMVLEKDNAIENLKSLYTKEFENIEMKSLDEETKELLVKYVDIKKAP